MILDLFSAQIRKKYKVNIGNSNVILCKKLLLFEEENGSV